MVKYICEYYRVSLLEKGALSPFDLEIWLNNIECMNFQNNAVKYYSDYMRIEEIYFNPVFQCWFLRFVRMRDASLPLICSLGRETEDLPIEANQLVAEPVVCLYDVNNNILMVQKNADSVSAVGIKNYLNELNESQNMGIRGEIQLTKIIDSNSESRIRNADNVRSITVRVSDLNEEANYSFADRMRSTLSVAINSLRGTRVPYLEIKLSVGRFRSKSVDENSVDLILDDVTSNSEHFDKAEFVIFNEETKSELVSLFGNVIKDSMEFENNGANRFLRFSAVSQKMGEIYYGDENGGGRIHEVTREG